MSEASRTPAELGLEETGPGRFRLGPTAPDRIASLAVDSRTVGQGALFAALDGVKQHGADHAPQAINAGAGAVLTDLTGALKIHEAMGDWPVPIYVDPDPRRRLALAAARFFGAQPETLVAATGTNGKTSTACFTQMIWGAMGLKAASFGTTGVSAVNLGGPDYEAPLGLTTPEPITLQKLLAGLAGMGVSHAAMEASSHGLIQRRLDGARLAAGAFLNLSRDHMDYHSSVEDYAAAKLRLFAELLEPGAAAVLNADEPLYPAARAIAGARGLRVIAFGKNAPEDGLKLIAQDAHLAGQSLRVGWGGETRRVSPKLVGGFQGWNALAAAGLAIGAGAEPFAAIEAIDALRAVRGRMELVARRANGAAIFVDFSHTPASIETALAALRPHTPGRLHIVVGAGGDRDPGKRPLMGAAAAAGADSVIVTDDNPRSEDPALIRAAVMQGAPEADEVGDRAEAILRAVDRLGPGDALLLAGKGHETGQEAMGVKRPFDDAEQGRAAAVALDGDEAELIGV